MKPRGEPRGGAPASRERARVAVCDRAARTLSWKNRREPAVLGASVSSIFWQKYPVSAAPKIIHIMRFEMHIMDLQNAHFESSAETDFSPIATKICVSRRF
jgi:hypothetical protein